MSTRTSLCLTKCTDEGEFADWYAARRAILQHGDHNFGCTQFVSATAYLLGSKQ